MKAHTTKKPKKSHRSPINLTLSATAVQQLEKLTERLNRPSRSNTVEHLITEAHKQAA